MLKRVLSVSITALMLSACGGGVGPGSNDIINTDPPKENTSNSAPIAKVETVAYGAVGEEILISGIESSDPDGDEITYKWTSTVVPEGGSVEIKGDSKAQPVIVATAPGLYHFELVVNDGKVDSEPSIVYVEVREASPNNAPTASFSTVSAELTVGKVIELYSNSYDVDGDSFEHRWVFESIPSGSKAMLTTQSMDAYATFTPDVEGEYKVRLLVTDVHGAASTFSSTIKVGKSNTAPLANIFIKESMIGPMTSLALDASNSYDADRGDKLQYKWSVVSQPAGAKPEISTGDEYTTSPYAIFRADVIGEYIIQLTVFDGKDESLPVQNVIRVAQPGLELSKIQTAQPLQMPYTEFEENVVVPYNCDADRCDVWEQKLGGFKFEAIANTYTIDSFSCTADYDVPALNQNQPKKCNYSLHNPLMPNNTQTYVSPGKPAEIYFYALVDNSRPVTYNYSLRVKETGEWLNYKATVVPAR